MTSYFDIIALPGAFVNDSLILVGEDGTGLTQQTEEF